MKKALTRRQFLNLVGAAGGTTAVYNTSLAMGLMRDAGPVARLDLRPVRGDAKSVAVLGAGLAGLTVAYELERAGYEVTVLEAAHRAGGRNMTVRHGDVIDEMGHTQVCDFDDDPDMYFNCGPARIPGHHRRVLHYCKTLKVPLQIKANASRSTYLHDPDRFDGKPITVARHIADTRGFISELLYKAVDQNAFDEPLSNEDQERIRNFMRNYGDLRRDGRYRGSERGGRKSGGFLKPAEHFDPIDIQSLLGDFFWSGFPIFSTEIPDWGEPLLEMVGGNDMIVQAFVREISSPIILNAQVQSINLQNDRVDVVYRHAGRREQLSVDYVFNNIPTHFMPGIPNNLPRDYQDGLAALVPGNFFKIGLQMRERFWESEGIYGGITSTRQPINQIWYPSHGIHGEKGVVLGAYSFGEMCEFFEKMTPAERIEFAGACGDKVHAGYSDYIESGVSVAWSRINHMMGCGTSWSTGMPWEESSSNLREQYYELLQQPAGGRHFMIGDQISYHSSWQEGALGSAEFALLELDRRVRGDAGESRSV